MLNDDDNDGINLDNFDRQWSCRAVYKLNAMNIWVVNEEEMNLRDRLRMARTTR